MCQKRKWFGINFIIFSYATLNLHSLVAEPSVIIGKFQADEPTVEKDETILKTVYCFQLISPNTNIGFPKIPFLGLAGNSQRAGLSHLGTLAGN